MLSRVRKCTHKHTHVHMCAHTHKHTHSPISLNLKLLLLPQATNWLFHCSLQHRGFSGAFPTSGSTGGTKTYAPGKVKATRLVPCVTFVPPSKHFHIYPLLWAVSPGPRVPYISFRRFSPLLNIAGPCIPGIIILIVGWGEADGKTYLW